MRPEWVEEDREWLRKIMLINFDSFYPPDFVDFSDVVAQAPAPPEEPIETIRIKGTSSTSRSVGGTADQDER
jgi:hypothetical protein